MGAGYVVNATATEADIYIYEDVGESWFGGVSAKQVSDDLKSFGNVGTINVHISSLGGDVYEGLAIYRQLVQHKAKIVSHIDGWACSIASVIAMAGDEILIAEAGQFMIHDASSSIYGRAEEMRKRAELLDTVTASIADVYAARTGQMLPQLRAWMNDETFFNASQAVENGFATRVMPNLKVAAHVPLRGDLDKYSAIKALVAANDRATPRQNASQPSASTEPVARPTLSAARARVDLMRARVAAKHTAA